MHKEKVDIRGAVVAQDLVDLPEGRVVPKRKIPMRWTNLAGNEDLLSG